MSSPVNTDDLIVLEVRGTSPFFGRAYLATSVGRSGGEPPSWRKQDRTLRDGWRSLLFRRCFDLPHCHPESNSQGFEAEV